MTQGTISSLYRIVSVGKVNCLSLVDDTWSTTRPTAPMSSVVLSQGQEFIKGRISCEYSPGVGTSRFSGGVEGNDEGSREVTRGTRGGEVEEEWEGDNDPYRVRGCPGHPTRPD